MAKADTRKWRPIINLKPMNMFIKKSFKMKTLDGVISILRKHHWAVSIYLQDAYYHIGIQIISRKYLSFIVHGKIYEFHAFLREGFKKS